MIDYGFFIKTREDWLLGNWIKLSSLTVEHIEQHPAKADLAILAASAWLAANNLSKSRYFISLALAWGSDKHKITQFLMAGVYNTLACAKSIKGETSDAFRLFEQAVSIEDFSSLDTSMLATQRRNAQLKLLNHPPAPFYIPPLETASQNSPAAWSIYSPKSNRLKNAPHQIIVLGMHRSGTSCITNLLKNMGAYFGEEGASTGANTENPRGFWERRDMRNITDKLLFSVEADWWKFKGFSLDKIPEAIKEESQNDFQIILDDLNRYPAWVLKEPRLSILFPIILPLLQNPLAICVYRNPLEVALSLKKRNGLPLSYSLALWEFYTTQMIINTEGINRIFVFYNKLIENPEHGLIEIQGRLKETGVNLEEPDSKTHNVIDKNLYRNKFNANEDLSNHLTIGQYNLYQSLKNQAIPDKHQSYTYSSELLKYSIDYL